MSARTFVTDTAIVLERRAAPGDPRPVLGGLQHGPAAGLPRPVRAAAGRRDRAASTAASLQWFVPGILVMTCLFGTSMTGVEPAAGDADRLARAAAGHPARPAGAAGRPGAEGDRAGAGPGADHRRGDAAVRVPAGAGRRCVVGLVLLAVIAVGLGSLSYALALAVREQEWVFWAVQQTLLFPLLLLAGMLLPLDSGPGWMRRGRVGEPAALRGRRRAGAVRRRRGLDRRGRRPGRGGRDRGRSGSGSAPGRWPGPAEPATDQGGDPGPGVLSLA